ncbi:DUF4184 family protein [Streptomyces sp. ZYX-F-203]
MPFTLSHAAAVLPVLRADGTGRAGLAPAVLVAGSFAPDTPYYLAGVVPGAMGFGTFTHGVVGVLTVDVPLAWLLVALWLWVRESMVGLLPPGVRGRAATLLRCGERRRVSARRVVRWYGSAALGALTHVVWDAFTHPDRWGTRALPALGHDLAGMPAYWYLQYGGSALAAGVLVAFVTRATRRVPEAPAALAVPSPSARERGAAVALLVCCAGLGAALRATSWWARWGSVAEPWDLIPALCFGAGAGLAPGILLYAALVRAGRPGRGHGEPETAGAGAGTPNTAG